MYTHKVTDQYTIGYGTTNMCTNMEVDSTSMVQNAVCMCSYVFMSVSVVYRTYRSLPCGPPTWSHKQRVTLHEIGLL